MTEPTPKKTKAQMDKDGGYGSRKFLFTIGMVVVVLGSTAVSAYWAPFGALYHELTNTLMGIMAIYIGGNTATKWTMHVASKKKLAAADKSNPGK